MKTDALEQFNQTIDTWISILNEYPFEMLIKQPIPNSWTLGQVFVHIIEDTSYHVQQMRTATLTEADGEKDMHDDAKWMFQHNMFPEIQIEGASTVDNVPQPISKETLLRQLTSIRNEVNDLYRAVDFQTLKGKSEHPGLWYFSALDWLRFTEMHMRHHFRQKMRITAALNP